jgi:type VI secretion system VasI/ImpG family protein
MQQDKFEEIYQEELLKLFNNDYLDFSVADTDTKKYSEIFALLTTQLRLANTQQIALQTQWLADYIAPQLQRPIPSCAIAKLSHSTRLQSKKIIPRGTQLDLPSQSGEHYYFSTAYDVELLPLSISNVHCQALDKSTSKLIIDCNVEGDLAAGTDALNLYLHNSLDKAAQLNLLLQTQVKKILLRSEQAYAELPADAIQYQGLADEQALLPISNHDFCSVRLIIELFTLAEKFMFIKITQLAQFLANNKRQSFSIEIIFHQTEETLRRLIHNSIFQLHCTPIINLFTVNSHLMPYSSLKNKFDLLPQAIHQQAKLAIYQVSQINMQSAQQQIQGIPCFRQNYQQVHNEKHFYYWAHYSEQREKAVVYIEPDEKNLHLDLKQNFILGKMQCYQPDIAQEKFSNSMPVSNTLGEVLLLTPLSGVKNNDKQNTAINIIDKLTFSLSDFSAHRQKIHNNICSLMQYIERQFGFEHRLASAIHEIQIHKTIKRHAELNKHMFVPGINIVLSIDESLTQLTLTLGKILFYWLQQSCSDDYHLNFELRSKQRGMIALW